MKRIIIVVLASIFFTSCKKESAPQQIEPIASTIRVDGTLNDHIVEAPKIKAVATKFIYATGSEDRLTQFALDISDDKNGALINALRNLRLTLGTPDSTTLYSSEVRSGYWDNLVEFQKNKNYKIGVSVEAPTQVFGTLYCAISINEGNGWKPAVQGQLTIFGYESALAIVDVTPTPSATPVNGDRVTLLALKLIAPDHEDVAYKQFAARSLFADNGTASALKYDSLTLTRDGVDETLLVTFSDSLGIATTSLSQAVAAQKKMYGTYTAGPGEIRISRGTNTTIVWEGTRQGFGPFTDGDAARITPINDESPAQGPYLNKGTNGVFAKLYTSPATSSSANNKVANTCWSKLSAGASHSGQYITSSNDWLNGYGISFTGKSTVFLKTTKEKIRKKYE